MTTGVWDADYATSVTMGGVVAASGASLSQTHEERAVKASSKKILLQRAIILCTAIHTAAAMNDAPTKNCVNETCRTCNGVHVELTALHCISICVLLRLRW